MLWSLGRIKKINFSLVSAFSLMFHPNIQPNVSALQSELWVIALFNLSHFILAQVNTVDALGETPLHRAAAAGQMSVCRVLLTHGADIGLRSFQGHTAAEVASEPVQKILQGTRNYLLLPFRWYHIGVLI